MSIDACLPGLVADGSLTPQRAETIKKEFQQLNIKLSKKLNAATAAEVAGQMVIDGMQRKLTLDQLHAVLKIKAQKQALLDMQAYGDKTGRDPWAAIRGMLTDSEFAPYMNAYRRGEALFDDSTRGLYEAIQKHRRNLRGQVRNRADMDFAVDVIHGDKNSDADVNAVAGMFTEAFEAARQRFNRAGGNIGKLEGGYFPHNHDARKVRDAARSQPEYKPLRKAREAAYRTGDIIRAEKLDTELIDLNYRVWRDDQLKLLDVPKMRSTKTGEPFDADTLEEAMRDAFDNIRTGGMDDLGPTDGGVGQTMLAKSRGEHRFFVYKDGPSWRAYAEKYGDPDAFNVAMGHLKSMARDTALMERFGPNPPATFRYLMDRAKRQKLQSGADSEDAIFGAKAQEYGTQQLWDVVTGKWDSPVTGKLLTYVGRPLAGTRNILTSAWLGSSPLSAIGDFNTQRLARSLAGLPQVNMISGMLKQLNPASDADRKLAVELGLGARNATQSMLGLNRYFGEQNEIGWTSILADATLRLSGNNALTEGGQRDFGLTFLRTLAREKTQKFDELDAPLRSTLLKHGIDADDWNDIRSSPMRKEKGYEYFDARKIENRAVGDKVMDMVGAETDAAIQMATPAMRALVGGGPKGTVAGELSANVMQFKTFTTSLLMTHVSRMIALGPKRGAIYAANFFVGMTFIGALSLQLKEISKGKDPRPMTTAEFWIDAALQGGGIGILGDFMGSFFNDRQASVASFVAGTTAGAAEDAYEYLIKPWTDDNEENNTSGIPRMIKRYTPIASSLWYEKLAFEQIVVDWVGKLADPEFEDRYRRLEQRAEKEGTAYYAPPGAGLSGMRAPDLENAFAESAQ
jgi:hypothetical protein